MSSAEDRSSTTIAPLPGPANSAPEEFPVDSPRPEKEDNPAALPALPPPVEPEEDSASPLKTKPLSKANSIAYEARIKVTGARAGNASVERELFTESTTTVLVFENGGVIRLAAAVAPGQLLFLTNEESKREIVAQVIRKRAFRPTECYVELEFTEPAPGFWGKEFSAVTALLPKDAKEAEAAEIVASAETTADEPETAAPHPAAGEVQALKKEVEALRSQLRDLQARPEPAQPVVAAPPKAPEPVAPVVPVTHAPASLPVSTPKAPEPAPVVAPPPEALAPPVEPAPTASFKAKSLPVESSPVPSWMAPAGQRKPATSYHAALPKRKRSARARGQFTPAFRAGLLRLAVPCIAVVALIGVLWFKHWLPGMHESRKVTASADARGVTSAASAPKKQPTPAPSVAQSQTVPPISGNQAQDIPNGDLSPTSPKGPPVDAPVETSRSLDSPQLVAGLKRPAPKERAPSRSSFPHSAANPSPAKVVDPPVTFEQDPNVVPPKLVKFARAEVSLNQVHDFETGDVVIDAVVDVQGDAQPISVISGPPSLRKPALKALKTYKYEPATLNGKPVPARITVRIQFHFEP